MFVHSKKDRNPSNTSKFIDAFFWWIFKFFFAFVPFIDKLLLLSFYTFNNIYNKPSKTICEHIRQMKRNLHIKIWTGKKFFFRSLVGTAQICFGQFFQHFFFNIDVWGEHHQNNRSEHISHANHFEKRIKQKEIITKVLVEEKGTKEIAVSSFVNICINR